MGSQADIPKQYKACVYDDPGKVSTKIEMLDMPEPGPGEVLINLYVDLFAIKTSMDGEPCLTVLRKTALTPACATPIWVSWRTA